MADGTSGFLCDDGSCIPGKHECDNKQQRSNHGPGTSVFEAQALLDELGFDTQSGRVPAMATLPNAEQAGATGHGPNANSSRRAPTVLVLS